MSTLTPTRVPLSPSSASEPGATPEDPRARAARLRLRRRLVLWSLPVVLLLALLAAKLALMVALGDQAREAYAAGNITGVETAAARLGFLNVIEPYKAPFARGDASVLAQDYDGARAAFEEALALAPAGSRDACQVRVNLVLSIDKLGAAATDAGLADVAKADNDRVLALVAAAPQGCFEGDATSDEGRQLQGAQQQAQQQQGQGQPQTPQDQQSQGDQPSQDKQQQLDDMTKDNLQQRGQGDQQSGSSGRPPVDKPW